MQVSEVQEDRSRITVTNFEQTKYARNAATDLFDKSKKLKSSFAQVVLVFELLRKLTPWSHQ